MQVSRFYENESNTSDTWMGQKRACKRVTKHLHLRGHLVCHTWYVCVDSKNRMCEHSCRDVWTAVRPVLASCSSTDSSSGGTSGGSSSEHSSRDILAAGAVLLSVACGLQVLVSSVVQQQ